MIKRLPAISIFVVLLSLLTAYAFAQETSCLHNPTFGALALTQGNAFVARADDASAIVFNPTGLTSGAKEVKSLLFTNPLQLF